MSDSSSSKKSAKAHQHSVRNARHEPQNSLPVDAAGHHQRAANPLQQEFPQLAVGMLKEINRLHAVARRQVKLSRQALDGALFAAWHAGKLLAVVKKHIRRKAGPGAWVPWVRTYFNGGLRTAQRYMRLARSANAPSYLPGIGLRQAYFRLGVPIEPKGAGGYRHGDPAGGGSAGELDSIGLPAARLSSHIVLANRLSRVLRVDRRRIRVQDLAPLYAQLRALFEREAGRRRR